MKRFGLVMAGLFGVAVFGVVEIKSAGAFDGDLVPRLSGTEMVTDGISDEDGSMATNIRTFEYTLGELSPGYTEDPGFQPQEGSGLPGGSVVGFNTVGPLLYWNGVGRFAVDFEPVTNVGSVGAELYLGPFNTFVGGSSAAKDGFVIQVLTSAGAGHRHLNAQLLGMRDVNGGYTDSLGATYDAPADGIYALAIEVTDSLSQTTDPATYVSGADYLVYNQNESDATLTAGADTLSATIVPEPGTLGILAFGLLMSRRRLR